MYTSGTTGDPKGVLISNENIITLLSGMKQILTSCNEQVSSFSINTYFFLQLYEHTRDT